MPFSTHRLHTRLCRRKLLSVGALGLGGLTLPQLLRATASANTTPRRPAKSVIVLYLNGGPSHLDMWDLKPDGPTDIRGDFRPVSTNVSGTFISEHLPRMAQLANKFSIIRSMSHKVRGHPSANYLVMTGEEVPQTRSGPLRSLQRVDRPHFGSVLSKLLGAMSNLPPFVLLPLTIQPTGPNDPHPGQFAGFLGPAHDPYFLNSDPNLADYSAGRLQRVPGLTQTRLENRHSLVQEINSGQPFQQVPAAVDLEVNYEKAFDILASRRAQAAFDITAEPSATRDRYGRHVFGQSALLARRLIEAGVRLVQVNWMRIDNGKGGQGYDSHSDHLPWAKDQLLPPTDAAFSSLLVDLEERGLLEETLVLLMGEFGRTPRFNKNAGRDHWPDCFSLVMAGGGIRGGQVYGASDNIGAYPKSDPVSPQDLLATVYHTLGINYHAPIRDHLDRPWRLTEGSPVAALL